MSEDKIKEITLKLAKSIKYLHANKIIHRDLKLSNILMNKNNEVKICDFGLALQLK